MFQLKCVKRIDKGNIDIEVNQVHRMCRSKSLAKSLVSEKLKSDKNCPILCAGKSEKNHHISD